MTMDDASRSGNMRSWVGLALLLVGVMVGGGMLELATGDGPRQWIPRSYLVLAVVLIVSYVVAVLAPSLREARELRRLRSTHTSQGVALRRAMDEFRHGDLVAALEPLSDLERETGAAVQAAAQTLAGLVQQIQTSSVEVATSATTVQETAQDLASGSSEQAAAVVEITATMEELARTAGQMASNAASQAELASRSEEAGDAGADAVEAAVTGVEAVRERMDAIAARADVLDTRSREIYRVLDLITEIAQETHILALNAAIEASAAGAHGERFSVVAEEVRRLAERSRESVDSVRTLLEDFSEAIRAVVVATEEGSKSAAHVLRQSRSAEESIEALSSALADTARTAREISLATQEQRTASDQVVLTLREVSEVIQRMADGLKRFSGTAERLNHLALSIQLLTQSFRLDSPHSLKHRVLAWCRSIGDFAGNLEAVEARLRQLLADLPYAELVYVVDAQGTMAAFVINDALVPEEAIQSSVTVGQVYADRPWFQAVSRHRRTAVTPLYESLLTGDQCFTIAAAVEDFEGAMVGALGIDVNVRNWTRI